MLSLEQLVDPEAISPAPADKFELPKVYEGMDEIFNCDIEKLIEEDIKHFTSYSDFLNDYRLRKISEGIDPFGPELTKANAAIEDCDRLIMELWELDMSNELTRFQQTLRFIAVHNEANDLEKKYRFVVKQLISTIN